MTQEQLMEIIRRNVSLAVDAVRVHGPYTFGDAAKLVDDTTIAIIAEAHAAIDREDGAHDLLVGSVRRQC